jgi:hypothetical protein
MATLEELQERIQRLDDIKQIEQLQKIYAYWTMGMERGDLFRTTPNRWWRSRL